MEDNEKLKKVPYLEPKEYLKEGEYNLDDLLSPLYKTESLKSILNIIM